ncbi:MAG: macrolide ABC transporter ATP-binding protein [bacterium]|nr:MAG: macrolide ABC transporter ATP-binding protein [bacterium]
MVELQNISKNYTFHKENLIVLRDVNFKIKTGDFICVMGKSGSGKTTLLNIISGLTKPSSGTILFNNCRPKGFFDGYVSRFRSDSMGFIFQHFNLIPYHTVLENVIVPLKFSSLPAKHHKQLGLNILKQLDIHDKYNHYPHMLSGGQMQRVAIARALIKSPKLILADEPTGNLDEHTAGEIIDLFVKLNEENHVALLVSTHDRRIINRSKETYSIENQGLKKVKNSDSIHQFSTSL